MDSATATTSKPVFKPLGQLGRDEMNLAEFPITLLTDRVPKDQNEAIYQDEIFDERTGLTLTRKLTITAGNHGLTTPVDDEIILALIQLTRQKNNFTTRRVEFSRHELIQILGWSVGGAKYERIETSLDRWTSVYLKYENAWRDNRTKSWTSVGFHIIDKYEITDNRSGGDQLELMPSFIIWGEDIFQSFQAGYLKPLDYDLCMGLRNSTAKRMYRYLDKRFHHKPEWIFGLKEFAHEHIGLGRHYEGPAHLKRNLQPAIEELEGIGFLEPLAPSERFQKKGSEWLIRLLRKSADHAQPSSSLPAIEVKPSPLVTALIGRGVTDTVAVELVNQHTAKKIQAKIEEFDWLRAKKDKKAATNPAGFLVKSITTGKDGYQTPKGFEPQAERDRQAEAKRQKDEDAAAARRQQQAKEAAKRNLEAQVAAYRKFASPDHLAKLETDAIAQATDEMRQTLADTTLKRFRDTQLFMLVNEHIAQLLQSGELAVESA